MYNSGDAAEQVVRISLEGTEVALKLTGSAAKNIAAMLYAVWKNRDKNKTKGHQRLSAMLKSGKELKVFTVSEEHLKQFATEAKRYGVVYCALRGKERSADGMVDIMVRAEDASKINRIVERFKLATVDTVSIKRDIEQAKADKTARPPLSRRSPTRRQMTACWMTCWAHPSKRRSTHPQTLRRQRRRNPVRPRLPPRSKAEPPRVLLNLPKNAPLSVRNCGKFGRAGRKRRQSRAFPNPPRQKSRKSSRPPPTSNLPERNRRKQRSDDR